MILALVDGCSRRLSERDTPVTSQLRDPPSSEAAGTSVIPVVPDLNDTSSPWITCVNARTAKQKL